MYGFAPTKKYTEDGKEKLSFSRYSPMNGWKLTKDNKTTIYNKLIRYYISNTGEKLLKVKNPECTTNAAPISQIEAGEWICTVCNYLPKSHPLDNINFKYYIEKANKIIEKIYYQGKKIKHEHPDQLSLF